MLVQTARLSAMGELAAAVAHQINNPLTTILGDAEMLTVDLPPNRPEHASAQAILRAGQRAKSVVERILTMTRGEDEARPQDVNQTIQEMVEFVGQQIRQTGVELELRLGNDLPPVMISPGPMGDVWMNLLMNARDAIVHSRSSHGKITLSSGFQAEENLIEVIVADNGGGIAPEHLERVFDPFYTTKPHGKGTGLGLYICHQIINDHHGEILISSSPGEGTTVSVRLPIYRKEEVKP
jgi:two-component system NtrC family sensor kinase